MFETRNRLNVILYAIFAVFLCSYVFFKNDRISEKTIKIIGIISVICLIYFLIYMIQRDSKEKMYKTRNFIILIDILNVVVVICITYIVLIKNIPIIEYMENYKIALYLVLGYLWLSEYLISRLMKEKYLKENSFN